MSEPIDQLEGVPVGQTPASRLAAYVRGGGVVVPMLTALLAFAIGGLVVLLTGHDPIATYRAIFDGTGFQWFFPWVTGDERATAALNLQQTLILTTPLILVGLAVAFAFRAGLFNIGGQGQYTVGAIAAVWVGSSFAGMPGFLHIVLAIVAACAAGAAWAGIAGLLKATVGANEVISTIMLNYIAIGISAFLLSEPLRNDLSGNIAATRTIATTNTNSTCRGAHSDTAAPAAAASSAASWYWPAAPMLNRFILNPMATATPAT